jgi:hypothetical protein
MDLKKYLKKYRISKINFAKKLGIDRVTLYRYLDPEKKPSLIVKLAIEYISKGEVSRNDW